MNEPKKAFLIYRPVMDYEESMTPYLVCETKEKAEAVRDEIVAFATELTKQMGNAFTEDGEPLPDEEDNERHRLNEEKVNKAKWPYGIELDTDIPRFSHFNDDFNTSSVAVMELPMLT